MKLFAIILATGLSSVLSLAWAEERPSPQTLPSSASTTAREIQAAEQAAARPLVQARGLGTPERLPVIMERHVHMQSTDGKPVILEPGNYLIEISSTPPLKLIREWDNQFLMLSAQVVANGPPFSGSRVMYPQSAIRRTLIKSQAHRRSFVVTGQACALLDL